MVCTEFIVACVVTTAPVAIGQTAISCPPGQVSAYVCTKLVDDAQVWNGYWCSDGAIWHARSDHTCYMEDRPK